MPEREPMAEQIAAHDHVAKLKLRLDGALRDGDEREAKRLAMEYEQAKRRWHELVREAQRAMRTRRS